MSLLHTPYGVIEKKTVYSIMVLYNFLLTMFYCSHGESKLIS